MGHFTVAVISKDPRNVHRMLAPYQENNIGDCPEEYLEFYDIEIEERRKYESDEPQLSCIKGPDGALYSPFSSQFMVKDEKGVYMPKCPPGYERVEVPYKEVYKTFEEYMEECCGYRKDEKTGRYGYWENPNATWDWYEIGGRWQGALLVREDCSSMVGKKSFLGSHNDELGQAPKGYKWVDSAKIEDVQWLAMQDILRKTREKTWDEVISKADMSNPLEAALYGRYQSMKKEEYINQDICFVTYAVIMPDGKWHQSDNNDWDKKYFERFIKNTNPEYYITIVDCHI